MTLWSLSGHRLVLALPQAILRPVLPFLDRYVVVTGPGREPIAVKRWGVSTQADQMLVAYELPVPLFDCRSRQIEADCLLVKDARTSIEIAPSTKAGKRLAPTLPPGTVINGAVDYFDGERVRGWAQRVDDVGAPLTIGVFLDAVLIASVTADGRRRDLERKRGGSSRIGFQCGLPAMLFDGTPRTLCCAPLETLRPLRNVPVRVDTAYIEREVLALIQTRVEKLGRLLE